MAGRMTNPIHRGHCSDDVAWSTINAGEAIPGRCHAAHLELLRRRRRRRDEAHVLRLRRAHPRPGGRLTRPRGPSLGRLLRPRRRQPEHVPLARRSDARHERRRDRGADLRPGPARRAERADHQPLSVRGGPAACFRGPADPSAEGGLRPDRTVLAGERRARRRSARRRTPSRIGAGAHRRCCVRPPRTSSS